MCSSRVDGLSMALVAHGEKPTKLMHILVWQLEMYLKQHRQQYLVDHETNLKDANLVVDGLKSVNQLIMEITEKMITRFNLNIISNMS